MSEMTPELQSEIEGILQTSQKRHGVVYREMTEGLGHEEMATRHGKTPAHMKRFVTSVRHILDGTMPSTSLVLTNSYGYRELLNYQPTHDLYEHVAAWLKRLRQVKPEVSFEPLDGHALPEVAKDKRRAEVVEKVCPQCYMVHPGECY